MDEDSSHGEADPIEDRMAELETEVERLSRRVRTVGALFLGVSLFVLGLHFSESLLLGWPVLVGIGTAMLYLLLT